MLVIQDQIMLKNNHEKQIMNGDEGIITHTNRDYITVKFRDLEYNFSTKVEEVYKNKACRELHTGLLSLSYALTVYKSQGSEWDIIVFYIVRPQMHSTFINKKTIYSTFTRAKSLIYCVGDMNYLKEASMTEFPKRCDNLSKRIDILINK